MLCCFAKIVYYFVSIGYHVVDVYFDWIQYYEIKNKQLFTGAHNRNGVVREVFLSSCCVGSILGLAIVFVYFYYIYFHLKYLVRRCMGYTQTAYNDPSESLMFLGKRNDSHYRVYNCNRHYVWAEMIVSLAQLAFKDMAQSILLIVAVESDPSPTWPDIPSVVFIVCSVVAHLKLLVCFATKLCGFGAGEHGFKNWNAYSVSCVLGCIGSFVSLILLLISVSMELINH